MIDNDASMKDKGIVSIQQIAIVHLHVYILWNPGPYGRFLTTLAFCVYIRLIRQKHVRSTNLNSTT